MSVALVSMRALVPKLASTPSSSDSRITGPLLSQQNPSVSFRAHEEQWMDEMSANLQKVPCKFGNKARYYLHSTSSRTNKRERTTAFAPTHPLGITPWFFFTTRDQSISADLAGSKRSTASFTSGEQACLTCVPY